MTKDSLGDRMKNYEEIPSIKLMRRTPVIIRLDGKSFHTLTRGMNRPFDEDFIQVMQNTTINLVKNIEGCSFGYTQSDEISLLFTDYKNLDTQSWFDYKVQKVVSIAASMATAFFNHEFMVAFPERYDSSPAFFDARCFNVPREEVVNCFIWRQQDATRNSIQMYGQANFSHKQLHGKSCDEIQEMLFTQKSINWNDVETYKKRGTCCYKKTVIIPNSEDMIWKNSGINGMETNRTCYKMDKDIPIFSRDRNYIQKWVDVEDKC